MEACQGGVGTSMEARKHKEEGPTRVRRKQLDCRRLLLHLHKEIQVPMTSAKEEGISASKTRKGKATACKPSWGPASTPPRREGRVAPTTKEGRNGHMPACDAASSTPLLGQERARRLSVKEARAHERRRGALLGRAHNMNPSFDERGSGMRLAAKSAISVVSAFNDIHVQCHDIVG